MKSGEYEMLQERVLLIARFCLDTEGLDEMLAALDSADTLGPFVDPTLWMRGHEKLDIIRDIAKVLCTLKRTVEKHRARIIALEMREADRLSAAVTK